MNVTTEKVAEGQVALTIEVDPAVVDKAMNQAYHRLVGKTLVPGFRKGKAPRVMIERFLGRGALLDEALQRLIPEVVGEAAKEQNISPIAEPKYEVVQVEPVIIKATVDVRPVAELGNYKEIRATLNIPDITEEDVEKAVDQMRQSMATWETVERPVEFDDRVTVDIYGAKDGEERFTREGFPYSVRLDNPVPTVGFAANLVGLAPGEEKEFDMSFPADHQDTSLAGQELRFRVKVNEIKGKVLPPLNDEFAKRAGQNVETIEDLQRRVREQMQATAERRAKEELVEKIADEIVDLSTIEIPPSLVEHEVHRIIDDEERRFKSQRFSLTQYLNMIGKTPEQYHEEQHPVARKSIKRSLVLDKVGEAEEVKVEPEELDAEINLLLGEGGQQSKELQKFFASPDGRGMMEQTILNRKILRRLVEIATEGAVSYPEIAQPAPPVEAEPDAEVPSAEQGEAQAEEPAQD